MTTRKRALACTLGWALSVGMVVLATLPRDLQDHPHWKKVAWIPFGSGIIRPRDLLINLLVYLPVGYFMPSGSSRGKRASVVLFAFVLSSLMETAQVWSHSRFPSATDVTMNVLGAVIGASWADRTLRKHKEPGRR